MRLIPLLAPALLIVFSVPLLAQGDTIRPSPKAVEIRRVWKMRGVGNANFGGGFGSVGDINNDGIGDIAINSYIPWQWGVYLGDTTAPSTTPAWTFDSCGAMRRPVVGDFWGTGRKAVGFARAEDRDWTYEWLHIFRTEDNWLPDTPAVIWQSVANTLPRVVPFGKEYLAADLDTGGDDELIVSIFGARRGDSTDIYGELWIYAGGPEFQVETPTAVLRDRRRNQGDFTAQVADIDGDGAFDIVTWGVYRENNANFVRTYFYLGRPGSLPRNGASPDRDLPLDINPYRSALLDVDGDGITDIFQSGGMIFRSGTGKDPRTRSYNSADVDTWVRSGSGELTGWNLGYLNSRRFAVLGGRIGLGLIGFSGGPNGPDPLWDAWTSGGEGLVSNPFGTVTPVRDCTGDGWDDVMVGTTYYPASNSSDGIVLIFAGGPYIPGEDRLVEVRYTELEGKSRGLSVWPNPVSEQLNIAWRGDLERMPQRFTVHDMRGALVASGEVPEGSGSAVWICGEAPAGEYILSVFDRSGHPLAQARFIKTD